jgi:hypothetical protein
MPSTLSGLLIFVVVLTPGLLHYIQRRALSDQPQVSALVEAGTLTTVSLVTDLVAVGAFALIRWALPSHTPDPSALLLNGVNYAAPRLGYLVLWATALLSFSSALAIVWARRPGFLANVPIFIPALIDTSAWVYEFEAAPKGTRVYVGCDLRDGSYIGGYLDWYNTNIEEVSDRDIALVAPITIRRADGVVLATESREGAEETGKGDSQSLDFGVVVLSARDIATLYVSYLRQ